MVHSRNHLHPRLLAERVVRHVAGDEALHLVGRVAVEVERGFGRASPVALDVAATAEKAVELVVELVDIALFVNLVRQLRAIEVNGQPFQKAERRLDLLSVLLVLQR